MLFQRLALSRDPTDIQRLAREGNVPSKPEDLLRDPFIFEFLGLPSDQHFSEGDLEHALIEHLQRFLLELRTTGVGAPGGELGFAYVGRQYRISLANRHFYVNLVFYHRILKCFVLFDLKRGEVTHEDVGQMNLYLNYFAAEENVEDDNPPIGIVLGAHEDHILMEYATAHITNQLFVSKYKLHLPDEEALRRRLEEVLA